MSIPKWEKKTLDVTEGISNRVEIEKENADLSIDIFSMENKLSNDVKRYMRDQSQWWGFISEMHHVAKHHKLVSFYEKTMCRDGSESAERNRYKEAKDSIGRLTDVDMHNMGNEYADQIKRVHSILCGLFYGSKTEGQCEISKEEGLCLDVMRVYQTYIDRKLSASPDGVLSKVCAIVGYYSFSITPPCYEKEVRAERAKYARRIKAVMERWPRL